MLKAGAGVAMHFGTFKIGDEGPRQPIVELHKALKKNNVPRDRFRVLFFGEGWDVPPL